MCHTSNSQFSLPYKLKSNSISHSTLRRQMFSAILLLPSSGFWKFNVIIQRMISPTMSSRIVLYSQILR